MEDSTSEMLRMRLVDDETVEDHVSEGVSGGLLDFAAGICTSGSGDTMTCVREPYPTTRCKCRCPWRDYRSAKLQRRSRAWLDGENFRRRSERAHAKLLTN